MNRHWHFAAQESIAACGLSSIGIILTAILAVYRFSAWPGCPNCRQLPCGNLCGLSCTTGDNFGGGSDNMRHNAFGLTIRNSGHLQQEPVMRHA